MWCRVRIPALFFFQWATKPQSTVCTRVIGPVWRSSRVVSPAVHYLDSLPRESQWRTPQRRLHSICIRQIKDAVNAAIHRQGGARTRKSVNRYSSNNNDAARSRRCGVPPQPAFNSIPLQLHPALTTFASPPWARPSQCRRDVPSGGEMPRFEFIMIMRRARRWDSRLSRDRLFFLRLPSLLPLLRPPASVPFLHRSFFFRLLVHWFKTFRSSQYCERTAWAPKDFLPLAILLFLLVSCYPAIQPSVCFHPFFVCPFRVFGANRRGKMRFWEAESRMRPDARASLSMNACEAPLCGLAFNESAVKSSKCYVDVSGEETGEQGDSS